MLASLYNPKIQRGGTFSVGITAEDDQGNAMDFSVYDSMRIQVRPAWVKNSTMSTIKDAPLLSMSTTTGEIVVVTTLITLTLSAAVTAALTFNSGKYELEMIKDAVTGVSPEIIDKLLYGIMYVTGEVVV